MMKRRNGLPATGAIGLQTSGTTWASRVPNPPARTTASLGATTYSTPPKTSASAAAHSRW